MIARARSYLPVVLALGAACQVAQIVLLRELLMIFYGNEFSLGIILAAWMVWGGMGSAGGALLAERLARPTAWLYGTAAAVALLLPLSVLVIRVLREFFTISPGAYPSITHMIFSCLIITAPVGLLFGFQFVLLARVWREACDVQDAGVVGKTYTVEAAGNVIGGTLFTLVLVHYFGPLQTAVAAGLLMPLVLFWSDRMPAAGRQDVPTHPWLLPGALLAAGILTWPLLESLDRRAYVLQWHRFAPEYVLVDTQRSKHGTISVARKEDQFSFFQNGHLLFATAGPDSSAPAKKEEKQLALEEQDAVLFAHFAMNQHSNPQKILLIGGGLRGVLREVLRYPVVRVDYVEMDPILIKTARPYLPPATVAALQHPYVRLIHRDGRLFIKQTENLYDLILLDIPDPATAVINRYYTREFFAEARRRLTPGGILVCSAESTLDMRGSAVINRNATIYHTLRQVFEAVLPVGTRELYFVARTAPELPPVDAATLSRRYRQRDINAPGFSPRYFDLLLEETSLRRTNWILRHHGRHPAAHLEPPSSGPLFPEDILQQIKQEETLPPVQERFFINSDFKPIGYYYTLLFWHARTGANSSNGFRQMVRLQPWWILPVVAVVLLAGVVLQVHGRLQNHRGYVRYAIWLAAGTTGLSTMALQIALLFAFQSLYGFIYEMVGLITAVFMAGLALGAAFCQKYIVRTGGMHLLTGMQLIIALLAAAIGLGLPGIAAIQNPSVLFGIFTILTFVAGLINGIDFPLITTCAYKLDGRVERAAGSIYGIELLGACAGAIIASLVIAPVLGIVAVCLFAAVANTTAFLVLLISAWSR